MKVITAESYKRNMVDRMCFVCGKFIPFSDGHHWKGLGILVHGGPCTERVKAAAQRGRRIRDILAEIKNDPKWKAGR